MAIELNQREIIEALGNLDFNTMGAKGLSGLGSIQNIGTNLAGGPNNFLQNIPNIPQQQGPVLGPDDFGSYTIPFSDPTYRSGFDYARSIAGGMPMEQVIAPGVSYSPEQPGGYTQEQLNIPRDVEKLTPPAITYETPDDPTFFGTGIGGVNIPVDRKDIPFRNIFGGVQIPDVPPVSGLQDIGKLFDFDFDREAIEKIVQERIAESMPTIEQPDLSQFVTREDIPSLIPEVPTGREFSIDREALRKELMEDMRGSINIPDISGLARLEDIPTFDPDILKQDILMSIPQQRVPDVSKFVTQDDITKAISGIDMPTFQQPDLSAYDTRIAELEQQLAGLQTPTGGRFSVDQQLPRGLF